MGVSITKLKMIKKIKQTYGLSEFRRNRELEIDNIKETLGFKYRFDDVDYAFNELYYFYKNVSKAFEEILGVENLQIYSKEGRMILSRW